jgi:phosphoglucosamine mutase
MQENKKELFGTDGVRGRANYAPMTAEIALSLGRAVGILFRRHSGKHRVVIGKDTRLSCYVFENALIAGLCSMGIDTLMVGPLPTPGIAFITRTYRADAGIMISASHNAFYDNGIKFFSSEGYKFDDSWEYEVEKLVKNADFEAHLPNDSSLGRNKKIHDADGRYVEFVKGTFPRGKTLEGLRIALDCANGAGHRVAPLVFQELDADVHVIGNTPNGLNINRDCGSLHPEAVRKLVLEMKADVGIALDGDADRVVLVDEKGNIHDGDTILAICAIDLKEKGILSSNKVVGTVMTNLGLIKTLRNQDIDVVTTQVGDRYVIQKMLEEGLNLGGESSGHLIFSDYNSTGDALVAALQVLNVMKEKGAKLSELAKVFDRYPQSMVNVKVKEKPAIDSMLSVKCIINDVEKELTDNGRVLVRYSGTENLCRVMVEGPTLALTEEKSQMISNAIHNEIGA